MACKQSNGVSIPVVLRVKRKRTEEPAEALFIATKLRKLDSLDGTGQAAERGNVFQFAGTVQTPRESPTEVLTSVTKLRDHSALVKLSPFSKLSISDRQEAQREAKKALSSQRRFKLVSQHRALQEDPLQSETTTSQDGEVATSKDKNELVCLYDLEEQTNMADDEDDGESGDLSMSTAEAVSGDSYRSIITCNSSPMVREKVSTSRNEFVYDLYFTHTRRIEDITFYNWSHVSAYSHDQELVDERLECEEECYDEEEDSNDENHWKNDYPDEVYSDEEEDRSGEDSLEEGYRGGDEEPSVLDGNYWDEGD